MALGIVLADPTGELSALRAETRSYPAALTKALVGVLWEARFLVGIARKGVSRRDATYVAGCLFRVVGLCCHALHGTAGRWVVNEKGLVASTGRLPVAPEEYADRAHAVLADLRSDPGALTAAVDRAAALVEETERACHGRR